MLKRGKRDTATSKSCKSLMKKRAQVTIFVILGIVIFVVMIFALFVSSTLAKLKIQGEANKAVDAYLASESVNYYVYTCMDSAVTSAIQDIALQGGTFFNYQNGPYIISSEDVGIKYIPFNITYTDTSGLTTITYFNVSYSILNRSYCGIVEEAVPEYPYSRMFVSELYGLYNNLEKNSDCLYNYKEGYGLSGFAGLNNLTRLCKLGGNNTKSIKGVAFSPCYNSIIKEVNRSVEYLLEQQISIRMKNCTDFKVFVDDNITVLDDPVTVISYTAESIFAETTYNLSVKIKNKEPVVVKHSFNYKSDLRLVRLHHYLMALLKADSQDFFFSIKDNYESYGVNNDLNPEMFFDKEYMAVKIINFTDCKPAVTPDCERYKYDHIIIVEDSKSKIGNKSLTYVTAIKNRIPVLDFVHQTFLSSEYDVVASDSQEIKLTPMGYDPDDRNVTYQYEGWKETWDDNCELIIDEDGVDDPLLPLENKFKCVKIKEDVALHPKNWSKSILFDKTKKDANYTTNKSDMGPHVVRITTIDESGLYDFQDVKILVFDMPKAVISPIKVYSDVGENRTSIEDKFVLDSSKSTASIIAGGEIKAYVWSISKVVSTGMVNIFNNRTDRVSLTIPVESYEPSNVDDNELIQIMSSLILTDPVKHNVTLVVESNLVNIGAIVYSPPDGLSLDVSECLPHRNDSDFSFPYNNGNPFDANHSCCGEGYNVIDANGAVCYTENKYGEYNALVAEDLSQNTRFTNYPKSENYFPIQSSVDITNYNNANDIYSLTFERFCDGKRGNICAGDMKKTIKLEVPCGDKSLDEEETCLGPASSEVSDGAGGCEPYSPGTSFETIFQPAGRPATGICNIAWRCSSLGESGYDAVGGKHLCQATCSNGACQNTDQTSGNCACSTACGAVCVSANSFNWTLNTCKHSCDLGTCDFNGNQNLPCAYPQKSCYSTITGFSDFCYSNVSCTGTNGIGYTQGDRCVPGVSKVLGENNICLHPLTPAVLVGSNRCGTAGPNLGKCMLLRDNRLTKTPCPVGQEYVCDNAQGWICNAI